MKKQFYSIQGIIFQKGHSYGVDNKPGIGTAATIKTVMNYSMFHGIVSTDEIDQNEITGVMVDRWGESIITDFKFSENSASFKKQYNGRPEIIYTFDKNNQGILSGSYSGQDCGSGETKLIITPIQESFFFPEEAL